jgi:hypothetical protein
VTTNDLEAAFYEVQCWAKEEIEKIVYQGTRPISICATVEAATREVAIACGNMHAHATEIEEIESVANYVTACLKADFIHQERPSAPSDSIHGTSLRRFGRFLEARARANSEAATVLSG